MITNDVYIVEPSTPEEAKALKAFAKALKIKITKQNTEDTDSKEDIKTNLKQAVTELNLIKEGKLKGISAKDLLDEL
ncbi:hypothetical protein HX057_15980 [Myroides odoratimimus]|uniref:Uncharacterized protein n=3 Tax=Myroides TaxID=76831 RepID=A0AAI8G5I4_9FLAO|nr:MULTISPECIES: hypothetical protein [Myroides]AJH14963.1 hypothetical protein MPR_1783 [Myroides profundi]ALU27317.1 hypothetical protein AS202_14615 [Myroides odoratimimus]EHO08335.1 hypothetical protein HMPREF9712_01997 [Myroides odoratimimus CCUG 10230]EHO09637.1 hypothetical protein HMPREF9714_01908 [Myroides odoratimimus CCUG 12901]EPH12166.1 hypothetical protein HMPREF9713_01004 [Myroides odoratimimus CCUG 12700]